MMNILMTHTRLATSVIIGLSVFLLSVPTTSLHAAESYVEPQTKMEFVYIQGGTFVMGDLAGVGSKRELPTHKVTLGDFYMGKYEVTFEQYEQYCSSTDTAVPFDEGWGRENRPVIGISWMDAAKFAIWLSNQSGRQFRLPTESEWEYAARAGSTTIYWWGNDVGTGNAHCQGCGLEEYEGRTVPVGTTTANAWGLYDMLGNVYEWTLDNRSKSYADAPVDGSAWFGGSTEKKITRGGSWQSTPKNTRSASRDWDNKTQKKNNSLGIRLVMEVLPVEPASGEASKSK